MLHKFYKNINIDIPTNSTFIPAYTGIQTNERLDFRARGNDIYVGLPFFARNDGFWLTLLMMMTLFMISANNAFAINDSFDKTIEDLIYEKINDPKITIELQYESKDKVETIRKRESQINSISLINFEPNYSNFKVRINYNNHSASDELFGKYISLIEVPVLSRQLRAGEIITDKDIIIQKTKLSKIRENYIIEAKNIVGMQAKKHLSSGVFIKNNEIVNPHVIKQNDPVNIIYSSNNIKLKTSGVAINSGGIGDMIKVKNSDTGVLLLGQIVSKNTVQVGSE